MKDARYASKDFSRVPATLTPEVPERLLHAAVLDSPDQDAAFSRERQHLVKVVDLPSRFISMTLGALAVGQSTRLHRHNYETIIYVLKGRGKSRVEDREVEWKAGDAFYVPVWAWHRHINLSETEETLYVACENAPQLLNMGLALREEQ
jgi:quercetin dioxygenase-like cupin family protein